MIKVALKGLAGRKVRALLTALAVVIGVSMVSGTFVLTDTTQKAFDGIFAESYEGTDAVVNGKQLVDFSSGGRATVDASLLKKIEALPAVAAAARHLRDLPEQLQLRQADRRRRRDHRPRGRGRWASAMDRGRPPIRATRARAGRVGGRRRRDRPRRQAPRGAWPAAVGDTIKAASTRPGAVRSRSRASRPTAGRLTSRRRVARRLRPADGADAVRQGRRLHDSISVKAAEGTSPEALTRADQAAALAWRPPTSSTEQDAQALGRLQGRQREPVRPTGSASAGSRYVYRAGDPQRRLPRSRSPAPGVRGRALPGPAPGQRLVVLEGVRRRPAGNGPRPARRRSPGKARKASLLGVDLPERFVLAQRRSSSACRPGNAGSALVAARPAPAPPACRRSRPCAKAPRPWPFEPAAGGRVHRHRRRACLRGPGAVRGR